MCLLFGHDRICNDRLGKKIRVKCNEDDTIGDLKKLLAAQTGTRPEKLRIQKWYTVYKDHITLEDYEIHDGMGLELYCKNGPLSVLFDDPQPSRVLDSLPSLHRLTKRPDLFLFVRLCRQLMATFFQLCACCAAHHYDSSWCCHLR